MGHVTDFPIREAKPARSSRAGFTLLEMIGVLAILGILATALVPNAIRAIDRAAVKAERGALDTLGEGLRSYLIENQALPTTATWPAALATYTDKNAADVSRNTRGVARSLIYDPASAPAERAIILSAMRSGLALPTAANINTAARFQSLWDAVDGEIPSTASWTSWSSWNNVDGSGDSLVIERVNLRSIYLDELKTSAVALNNTTSTAASYQVEDRSGAQLAAAQLAAGASVMLNNLSKGDRVHIYSGAAYSNLIYTHIAAGDDISFDLSAWIADASGGSGSGGSGNNGNSGNGNNGNGNGNGNNGNGKGNGGPK